MPASRTDPAWIARALAALDEVLLDHAHCERKAAGTALTLLFQYPDRAALQAPLAALAREELAHFEEVLAHLSRRGVVFRRQRPSAYAGRLRQRVRSRDPERLVDTLLCCALIESRSCERLGLLAEAVPDPALAHFYAALERAEARHQRVYVELAEQVAVPLEVGARLAVLAAHEADVIATAPPPAARLHS